MIANSASTGGHTLRRGSSEAAWPDTCSPHPGGGLGRRLPGHVVHPGPRLPAGAGGPVKIERVELRRVPLPLLPPFRPVFGTQNPRDVLLVRVEGPDSEGWGECVAMNEPLYSSEYVEGAHAVTRAHLVPRLWPLG